MLLICRESGGCGGGGGGGGHGRERWRKCRLGRYGCFSTRGLCHSGRVAFIKYDVVLNPNEIFFFFESDPRKSF